jgi:hypothetical protein
MMWPIIGDIACFGGITINVCTESSMTKALWLTHIVQSRRSGVNRQGFRAAELSRQTAHFPELLSDPTHISLGGPNAAVDRHRQCVCALDCGGGDSDSIAGKQARNEHTEGVIQWDRMSS